MGGEPRRLDAMVIEGDLQSRGDRRNDDRHDHSLHGDLDYQRPSSHPFAAAGGEVEMHRPDGERYAHSMDAAAQVVRERGFAQIVDEIPKGPARNQADHG